MHPACGPPVNASPGVAHPGFFWAAPSHPPARPGGHTDMNHLGRFAWDRSFHQREYSQTPSAAGKPRAAPTWA